MSSHGITVRHNFETAHRLPHLPGKCESLHGHSWWADVTVEAPDLDADGIVVEFGPFKQQLRRWIDERLDHGVMLGPDDPLVPILAAHGCKIHTVPGWPTVENVAALIGRVAVDVLSSLTQAAPYAQVTHVRVSETHVNDAHWTAS